MKLIYLLKQNTKTNEIEEFTLQRLLETSLFKLDDSSYNYSLHLNAFVDEVQEIDKFIFSEFNNIETINVIIGENASGKSTLLESIKNLLNFEIHEELEVYHLGIFFEESESCLYILETSEKLKIEIRNFIPNQPLKNIRKSELQNIITDNSVIYFSDVLNKSNFFDDHLTNSSKIFNSTLGYSLRKASKESSDNRRTVFSNPISTHFNNQMNRQLNFIRKTYISNYELPYKIPDSIHIEFDSDLVYFNLENTITKMIITEDEKEINKSVKTAIEKIQSKLAESDLDSFFAIQGNTLLLASLLQASLEEFDYHNNELSKIEKSKNINSFFKQLNSYEFPMEIFHHQDIMSEILNLVKRNFDSPHRIIEKFENEERDGYSLFFLIDEFLISKKEYNRIGSHVINFRNEILISFFKEYLDEFYELSPISFLRFHWGMSTGEEKLFNLHSQIMESRLEKQQYGNIWILIDEADSSLGPKWQADYINKLTKVVSQIFKNENNIQIILTSHSPILLSDIPHHNICYTSEKISDDFTFNQNIYSLFTDIFSLDKTNGQFSDHVLKKLDEKILELKSRFNEFEYFSRDRKENFRKELRMVESVVKIIGEDVIRFTYQNKIKELSSRELTPKLQDSIKLFSSMNKDERESLIRHIIDVSDQEEPFND
ncbi:AAA family ATPase [Exiguobacterium sp. S22-S28]|uniref:AAA family ATPase n=1 Tax=Exiguobacterium sp. S22-S28 TaxID=3342768 RepID=UPI00372D7ECA